MQEILKKSILFCSYVELSETVAENIFYFKTVSIHVCANM